MINTVLLRPLHDGDLPSVLAIYHEAFPSGERKDFSFMTSGPFAPDYDISVIETPYAPVSGIAILVRHGDLVLLDYFAVSPALRGLGIGRAVLPLIRERCNARFPHTHLFLEIEVPCEDCENAVQRRRRKAFYLSAGLTETGIHAFIYGSEMELLSFPVDAPFITADGYRALLTATFPPEMVPADI